MKLVLLSAALLVGAPDVILTNKLTAIATACEFRQADAYVMSDVRSDEAAKLSFDACVDWRRRAAKALFSFDEDALQRIIAHIRRTALPTLTQYIVQRRRQMLRQPAPSPQPRSREQSL